ncbi:MAG TPA: GMC family oxidoreductase N-terminal domain-containing protein [Nocardioidaceae bacterium]|nr:GMC family oxidoreductase N-terminal domain-containing protein [Nocardioidaceae bacterium]
MAEAEGYDHVVVGAGSAGCVLAARLTEDPDVRVLLLEAGGDDRVDEISIPAAFSKQFRTRMDWGYSTDEQKHAAGRRLYWPRGKSLGGSSSMNAMIYIRGSRADYDEWADLTGERAWSYAEVLPLFKRSEDNERGPSEYHSAGGPLRVEEQRSPHPWTADFLSDAAAAGYSPNPDFNGASQEGSGLYQVTQRRGRRWSAASAFLRPALGRPNLTVRTNALSTRVLVEGRRAVGVEYRSAGSVRRARVEGEVLLSGGAINSPQLLMLSGIGPAPHLRDVGVDVVHDLPGVGHGLQDHPVMPVICTARGSSLRDAESLAQVVTYYTRRRGMLTSNIGEGGVFLRSRPHLPEVDLQFHFAPVKFWAQSLYDPDDDAWTIGVTLVRVASTGSVRLRSADPTWAPAIDGGYLSDEEDLDALVAGTRIAREVARGRALASSATGEWLPGPEARTDDDLREAARDSIESLYHPASSCRMGTDDLAVVDSQLRVHGLDGLRVVDASVMPTLVRGNTNAPTIMIAERAADLVRAGAHARLPLARAG